MATTYYPGFQAVRITAAGVRTLVTSATITAYNVTTSGALSSIASDSSGNVAGGSVTATAGDIIRFGHATYPEYIYFTLTATQAEAYVHQDNIECAFVMENLATNGIGSNMVELYAQDLDNLDVTPWKIGEGYSGTTVEIPYQSNVAKNLRIFPRTIDKKLSRVRSSFQITTNAEDVVIPSTDSIASLANDTWEGVRRNYADTAYEAYDTRASRPLFSHFADRTTTALTEQTMHTYSVTRASMAVNGDSIQAEYTGILAANANDKYVRLYFNSTEILDTDDLDPALGNSFHWTLRVTITRVNSTTVRCGAFFAVKGFDTLTRYTSIGSLDLDGTDYLIDLKLETPTTVGDATLKMAEGLFINAPAVSLPTGLWAAYEARYFNGVGVALPSDGANITTSWQDITGLGNHATVSGTPTFETNECNGQPIVRLGADSNDYFTMPSWDAFTAVTFVAVLKVTNTTTSGGNNLGDSGDAGAYTLNADGIIYDETGTTVRKTCGLPITPITSYHLLMVWSASNDYRMELNGMLQYATATNTVGSPAAPTIGFNGSAQYMKVDVPAIYVDNAKMTAAKLAQLAAYVAQNFGV